MTPRVFLASLAFALALAMTARAAPMSDFCRGPAPQTRIYKTCADGSAQKLHYFTPAPETPAPAVTPPARPAVVWMHGGGWTGGTPDGFMPHARYCASRGAVAFNITYRLAKPDGPTVADCIADCKSAIRHIRAHAAALGVDPNRIAVAGDSAGGHLAGALGTIDGHDDPADNPAISARPDAMIMLNPVTDMTDGDWMRHAIGGAALAGRKSPLASAPAPADVARAIALSPLHNIRPGQPPALLIHGAADKVVPCLQSMKFAALYTRAGNACELILLPDAGHAFGIAWWRSPEPVVVETLRAIDRYLTALGWFSGPPTLTTSATPPWNTDSPGR
ncbi:MAG: alpha/beta hydrolase [Opitutaceae bacterium]|jgi:acetyl esterase/lipase|nr:alpha/beta hydrolase [Opitutaceae bacterium]